ncbi:hypothetical protein KSP40_PGU005810 [Platanthera guangdongensis]|uniref:Uncharacterized protein n=1 Tax=Platanthera guangdongensis TaxID=2320717 RepID=A0ABR2MF12_9ASPA
MAICQIICATNIIKVKTNLPNPTVAIRMGKVKDIELKGHTDSVDQLCWDPKHADLLATAAGDKTVRLWDARRWITALVRLVSGFCEAAEG